jgi:hypothetical protein
MCNWAHENCGATGFIIEQLPELKYGETAELLPLRLVAT